MKKKVKNMAGDLEAPYELILGDISSCIDAAKAFAARSVNCIMTAVYWMIGQRIFELEQRGMERAEYGEALLKKLSRDLSDKYGRGFAKSNLYQMRSFYLAYQNIFQTPSGKSGRVDSPIGLENFQTPSGTSEFPNTPSIQSIATRLPLPWSAYVRLLAVKNETARKFYETEALRGGWSVRQLDRQINSQFYERTALSRNKAAMLRKAEKPLPEDHVNPAEEIKDPFVLEFLTLKANRSLLWKQASRQFVLSSGSGHQNELFFFVGAASRRDSFAVSGKAINKGRPLWPTGRL